MPPTLHEIETPSSPAKGQALSKTFDWRRDPSLHLAGLFVLAIGIGGGGVSQGLADLAVQLGALLVMALHPQAFWLFFVRHRSWLSGLVIVSLLLPLLQLVPLPPAIWSAFPGRDLLATSLDIAGGVGWYPLSLFPGRTLTAALSLITPVAIIVVGSALPTQRLAWLSAAVAGMGCIVMLFGSIHLFIPSAGYVFEHANERLGNSALIGTFSDRNAMALFFDICLLLVIALPAQTLPREAMLPRIACGVLLAVGALLTQSRTGSALLIVPLALLGLRGIFTLRANARKSMAMRPVVIGVLCAIMVGTVMAGTLAAGGAGHGGRIGSLLERIDNNKDGMRKEMREDALTAAKHYWPVGAGMGTFDDIFQVDESLEYLSPRKAGRAHMDFYEFAIESGVTGLIILVAWLFWALVATWKSLRDRISLSLAGLGFFVCIAGQSLLSFPLRNQTMLAMAGLGIVLASIALRRRRESA